jgi:hypothetical protein
VRNPKLLLPLLARQPQLLQRLQLKLQGTGWVQMGSQGGCARGTKCMSLGGVGAACLLLLWARLPLALTLPPAAVAAEQPQQLHLVTAPVLLKAGKAAAKAATQMHTVQQQQVKRAAAAASLVGARDLAGPAAASSRPVALPFRAWCLPFAMQNTSPCQVKHAADQTCSCTL